MNRVLLQRIAEAWWLPICLFPLYFEIVVPAVLSWGVSPYLAGWIAVTIVGFVGWPWYGTLRLRSSSSYDELYLLTPLGLGLESAASTAVILWLAEVPDDSTILGPLESLPAQVAVVAWTFGVITFGVRKAREALDDRVLTASEPRVAMKLAMRCDAKLEDDTLDDDRRAALMLSLSGALIVLSAHADQDDMLPVAFDILEDVYEHGAPKFATTIGMQFARAMEIKLLRTGERLGYDDSLETMSRLAEEALAEDPQALDRVIAARAAFLARRAERARADGDDVIAESYRLAATEDYRAAVRLAAPHSEEEALLTIALTLVEGPNPLDGDLDDAIKHCRRARRRLLMIGFEHRPTGQLALAQLLELRAGVRARGGARDALRALWLYTKLALGHERKVDGRRRWPHAYTLLLSKLSLRGPLGQGRLYGALYASEVKRIPGGAIEIAARWAAFAMQREDRAQAAEAWWCWITAVSSDLRRRVLHDKERRLPQIQEQVAVAARWMVAAGRLREAALTLELGRAVLLTDRLQRRTAELERRLRAAGHDTLADRWRDAGEALEREQHVRLGTAERGDDPTPYSSSEYHALVEHDWLLNEISELAEFPDIDATPTYRDLRAAAAEGPLVYLATTIESGFALVVTSDAADPVQVPLQELTQATVDDYVARIRGAESVSDLARTFRDVLPALNRIVFEPLLHALQDGALTTLIPTGSLGELPLHAAACVADERGIWRDHGAGRVFRYAPNARMLLRSQRIAGDVGRQALDVLTAAVPLVPGEPELRHAAAESRGVARLFGSAHSQRLEPATVDAVQERLDSCRVWHFACHGQHEAASPLDSRLLLADGRALDLRTILSRSGGDGRLAVLSACQTANVDGLRPDEVVGFPSALLQAGLAGVVSCQGKVDDAGAMLLVLRFFEIFVAFPGVHPARALAAAQEWLRTSTNADFEAAFPDAYVKPADASPTWGSAMPFGLPATWALFNYTGA